MGRGIFASVFLEARKSDDVTGGKFWKIQFSSGIWEQTNGTFSGKTFSDAKVHMKGRDAVNSRVEAVLVPGPSRLGSWNGADVNFDLDGQIDL